MLGLSSCILIVQMRKLRLEMVTLYLLLLTSKWHLNPYPNNPSFQSFGKAWSTFHGSHPLASPNFLTAHQALP